jgi:hypothetical protein
VGSSPIIGDDFLHKEKGKKERREEKREKRIEKKGKEQLGT